MVEQTLNMQSTWLPKPRRCKTDIVLQMEAVEYAAASLSIMLRYYGKYVTLGDLRIDCAVSRDGATYSSLEKAATNHGLKVERIQNVSLSQLDHVQLPCIIQADANQFIVLEGFSTTDVYLNDPSVGPRQVSFDEFLQLYSGTLITLEPTEDFEKGGEKPSVVRSLQKRFAGNYASIVFMTLLGVLLALTGLMIPIFSKIYIDNYLIGQNEAWLRPLLIGMGITAIARFTMMAMTDYYMTRFETRVELVHSANFLWHVMCLPISFFAQRRQGDISDRLSLNYKVAIVISRDVALAGLNLMIAVFYLMLLSYFSPLLALLTLLIASPNIFIAHHVAINGRDKSLQSSVEYGKVAGIALNGLATIETLKASGRENDFFEKIIGTHVKYLNARQRLKENNNIALAMPTLLSFLTNAMLLLLGSQLVINGSLTVGMLVAIQSLAASFLDPVNNLVNLVASVQQLSGDMNKIDDVMKYDKVKGVGELLDTADEQLVDDLSVKLNGYIRVENLSFGYSPLDPPLIENFSISLKPGDRIAIVGSSGSGKSTIAKLLARLYRPWSGQVYLDETPIEDLALNVLYNSLAIVDQDISMFKGSVRDNICMWDDVIDEEEMIVAAKDACIHDVITDRELAYDSLVAENGSNFSGGELQRLEIARALAPNPRVLIMDEATSSLDPLTEHTIDNNIRRRGCTTIVVAHRLSTIRDCDEIIVLDKGKVVERGKHDDLVKLNGEYARLISFMGQ